MRLWDVETGKPLGEPMAHNGSYADAVFSPDGPHVVTTSEDNSVWLWDGETGNQLGGPMMHEEEVKHVEFSSDGRRILTVTDETVRLWDVETGKSLDGPLMHEKKIFSAHFSPDGQRILTASEDKTTRLWDGETGEPLSEPIGHDEVGWGFSPDGQRVLTVLDADKTFRLWKVFLMHQDLVDEAKQIVPRCLTRAQREQVHLSLEPPSWCIEMGKWPYHTRAWKAWLKNKRARKNPEMPKE